MSDSHRVTLQAFLHHAQENPFAGIEFVQKHGGKLEVDETAHNAHARFHGHLESPEVAVLHAWCTRKAEELAGSGAIVLIVDDNEPDKFEWHDDTENRRHWLEELRESSESFLSEFHHLMHF